MAATAHLMTVEEFRMLPEDQGPVYHELRHGELVSVTHPKLKHLLIQGKLRDFLKKLAEPGSLIETEVAFRPLPEYELRVADVAWLSAERLASADMDDNIQGAPDLVIEVLSPSNTAVEIYDNEKLCLENGCREFWIVDPERRQVKVSTPDGHTVTYPTGQEIVLALFGGAALPVKDIFD
ncbi:MAG: Uma2 family endonuclease [Bryobacteraceae bacterium]